MCGSGFACTEPSYDPSSKDAASDAPVDAAQTADDAGRSERRDASGDAGMNERQREDARVDTAQDDGGASDANVAPADDAATLDKERLPAWGEQLLGVYAAQTYVFSRDKASIMATTEERSLVRIERAGSGAIMRVKLCSQVASSDTDQLRMVNPLGLPEIARKLQFDNDRFSTDAEPMVMAFERAVPADCIGKEGQGVPKRPAQAWISGDVCRCPSSAALAPRADDCRVLDPDGDKKPGLTYVDKGIGIYASLIDFTVYAAYVTRSHPVAGSIKDNGALLYAQVVSDEVAFQLDGVGAPEIADLSRPCTSDFNYVQYVRLAERAPGGEEWSCEKLLANSAAFTLPVPKAPGNCTRHVLTDDPMRE